MQTATPVLNVVPLVVSSPDVQDPLLHTSVLMPPLAVSPSNMRKPNTERMCTHVSYFTILYEFSHCKRHVILLTLGLLEIIVRMTRFLLMLDFVHMQL